MNRPIHFEILVDEPEIVSRFYSDVFGWTVSQWGDPNPDAEQGYFLVGTGESDHPGIDGALMHKHFEQSAINTIDVENLEDTIQALKNAGGTLLSGPNEISGDGVHAYCKDPAGVIFGVMHSIMD